MKHDYKANFRVNKELWDLANHHFPNRSEAIRDFLILALTNNDEVDLRNNISFHEQKLAAYESQLNQLLEEQMLHETIDSGIEKAFAQCKAIHDGRLLIGRNVIKMKSVENKIKYSDLLSLCEKEKMNIVKFIDIK